MGITRQRELNIDVVTAAQQRIINAFSNGTKIYLSCSGGKDSIVIINITYKLIQAGKINPQQLECVFVDEEAMYDDVIEIVKIWRRRFLSVGAKFTWFCMEYRQMNCFHSLENEETFVCWDRFQRDRWCRPMPSFAVTSHPLLKTRQEVYQKFLKRYNADGLNLIGVRAVESLQRRRFLAKTIGKSAATKDGAIFPIYDMSNSDVWLYIKNNGLEYPKVYEQMYACGVSKMRLRISNFFAIDSCAVLSKLYEYQPKLAEAVYRREPNAYLAQMYWDTEMFKRSTRRRKQLEQGEEEPKNYKSLVLEMLGNPNKYATSESKKRVFREYKKLLVKSCGISDRIWKKAYGGLTAGDPKLRTCREIQTKIGTERVGHW